MDHGSEWFDMPGHGPLIDANSLGIRELLGNSPSIGANIVQRIQDISVIAKFESSAAEGNDHPGLISTAISGKPHFNSRDWRQTPPRSCGYGRGRRYSGHRCRSAQCRPTRRIRGSPSWSQGNWLFPHRPV